MGMPGHETMARLSAALVSRGGGYLRNPVRQRQVTCAVCTTPALGQDRCFACRQHRAYAGLADASAFLTYAVAGQQSEDVMRGYKAPQSPAEHRIVVALLVIVGLSGHAQCPQALAGAPVTHWASVPSLPAQPGEHPLRAIVSNVAPGQEIRLAAAASARFPRDVNPHHFSAGGPLPAGSHVLLIDDTWAGGGHAQSAALGLRRAGADRVSLLVVARWIRTDFKGNVAFLRELATRDYDPAICPWTGGTCPAAGSGRGGPQDRRGR
jgi:predicted amidophosphoribosyltransferase